MPARPRAERRVHRRGAEKLTARRDLEVARRAAEQWGVVSVRELSECGLSADEISSRVGRGWLHPLHRGVYAVGHPAICTEGRFLAAIKACGPTAVLSHHSAAELWEFLDRSDRYPELTVRCAHRRVHAGIRVHRSELLPDRDTTSHRGLRVTTPARTIVDLAAQLDQRSLRQALRRAQGLRRLHLRQLVAVIDRLGPRRGVRGLRRLVATGPAPTRSVLEDVVLDLILAGGFARPDVNRPLVIAGRRLLPDFRWAAQRLIVEADGGAWHDHRLAREDDAERQAVLEAHGERVIRVTWDQAVSEPERTRARIGAAGAPPGPAER